MAKDPIAPDGLGLSTLLRLVNAASKKVPAVKYAFGLVGIAACGAIIALVLGTTKSALVILSLTFIGSILLFVFARLSTSSNRSIFIAGAVLIWSVVGFFTFFLIITTTAFVSAWPLPWAEFLGISSQREDALCQERVNVMWNQLSNSNIQYSDALNTAERVQTCAPFQAFTVKGAIAFYTGDYFGAVSAFESAHKINPADDPITRNLGDSYVEVGRYDDAISMYNLISKKNALWNYKIARVKFYKGQLDSSISLVRTVPSDLAEDGGLLGRPRILEAAILVQLAKANGSAPDPNILADAHQVFETGIKFDQQKWEKIFELTQRTKYETYTKQYETLKPYLADWLHHQH
jgi:hypothetical protein